MDALAGASKLCAVLSLCVLATLAGAPAVRAGPPVASPLRTIAGEPAAEPPVAAIVSPASGGVYALGAEVWTSVACTESARGPGIATCADTDGDTEGIGLLDTSSAGAHTYSVEATSMSGLRATATIGYTVMSGPAAPLLRAPASPSWRRSVTIRGTAAAGTTIAIYSTSDCSGPAVAVAPAATLGGAGIAVSVPADVTTRLAATAADALGQESQCSPALVYVNDSRAPNTAITEHPRTRTIAHRATFRFRLVRAEAAATLQCRLDSGRWRTCRTKRTVLVKRGPHSFSVRARDRAGNADLTPAKFRWRVR